jgi:uncharacterized protein (DUF2267 family)
VFISKRAYQDLQDELTKARAELVAQSRANQMLEATMNWFRHRITQIEAERAQLIHHALGVKIPSPLFEKPIDPIKRFMEDHPFSEQDIFRSLNDEEAAAEGLGWDNDGRLVEMKN